MGNKSSKWIDSDCGIPYGNKVKSIININNNELLVIYDKGETRDNNYNYASIGIYNLATNKLHQISEYSDLNFQTIVTSTTSQWIKVIDGPIYDHVSNTLSFLTATTHLTGLMDTTYRDHKMISTNMETKQFTHHDINIPTSNDEIAHFKMVNIKDKIHLLSDSERKHYVYDKKKHQIVSSYPFNWLRHDDHSEGYVCRFFYISTQNRILHLFYRRVGHINVMSFDLKTEKWNSSKNVEYQDLGDIRIDEAMLTMNEHHVIIPQMMNYENNDVYFGIMDINMDDDMYKVRKSKTFLRGIEGQTKYVIAGGDEEKNKVIVYGFIRRECNLNEMRMLSNDAIFTVVSYYVFEFLHCFKRPHPYSKADRKYKHSMIPVECIV